MSISIEFNSLQGFYDCVNKIQQQIILDLKSKKLLVKPYSEEVAKKMALRRLKKGYLIFEKELEQFKSSEFSFFIEGVKNNRWKLFHCIESPLVHEMSLYLLKKSDF